MKTLQLALKNRAKTSNFIWIHAVSLGETRVAGILLEALRQEMPDMRLLLTQGTATGRAEGQKLLRSGDIQVWQPWDTRAAVTRFLQRFQPRIGILIETELWPNMAAICAKKDIPLVIANARLSERTYAATLKFAWLARPAYQSLAAVWAQSKEDAMRLKALGAPIDMEKDVLGNLKFDARVDAALLMRGRAWRATFKRPVLMLASSREGEERQLLACLAKNGMTSTNTTSTKQHQTQYLIVPRHPQRFQQIADLIASYGFKVSKRSAWGVDGPTKNDVMHNVDLKEISTYQQQTIWLGDSLGDMALYYGMSDVALLGGSFEPLGGQNLIEAAACGCPVVMGPSTFNFAEAAQLAIDAKAAIQVDTMTQAVQTAQNWANASIENDSINAKSNGSETAIPKPARSEIEAFATAHQGAADKTMTAIMQLLISPTKH